MTLGIDVSNYTGEISSDQAQRLYAAGIRRAVIACQFPDIYKQQLGALDGAGIVCEAYGYLYNSKGTYLSQTRVYLDTVANTPIERLWLDCEAVPSTDDPMPVAFDVAADIADCLDEARYQHCAAGIYTGRWWWTVYCAGYNPGPGVRLWLASYDNDPADFSADFGGWTSATAKQYLGSASVAGLSDVGLDSWQR